MKKVVVLGSLMAAGLASCVSSGKYDELMQQKLRAEDSLGTIITGLRGTLSARDAEIDDLKKKVAALESDVAGKRTEIAQLRENMDRVKQNNSQEMNTLLAKLEALQADLNKREQRLKEVENALSERDRKLNALLGTLNNALLGFKESGLSLEVKNGRVYVSLSNQLLFASGSTQIDKRGKDALLELAKVLNTTPDINVLVEGHTDDARVVSSAAFKDNWDLSVLRSTEVIRLLTGAGAVDPTRVTASGRSEFQPVTPGSTPEIRSMNRRTEIILTPKLDELYNILTK